MAGILILEDDPVQARVYRAALAQTGFDATVLVNGTEAVRALDQLVPDLALLDVNTPGTDGYEVCRAIRAWEGPDRRVVVIMATAREDTASKLLAFAAGADDYLVKPIDLAELRSRVARWLGTREAMAETIRRRRLEAIREIVATVCHQVNNPLTSAVGTLDLLIEGGTLPPGLAPQLSVVRDDLLRIADVVQRLKSVEDSPVPYVGSTRMIDIERPWKP
ncbi:MAG: response regulator [Acidobacteriota bacterium]